DRAERTRGLLTTVKSITESTDRVVLMGERVVFLIHRLPFVLRLHVRQAFREILSDLRGRLLVPAAPLAVAAGAACLLLGLGLGRRAQGRRRRRRGLLPARAPRAGG
ncbi:MAG: hypothetical protein JOZ69_09910, partial [Myxococcales bacterium]|nr:hypothetical protein [Myxococcales bacterium]